MRRKWEFQCSCCGKKFPNYAAEAKHRHNFPAMCNTKSAQWRAFQKELNQDNDHAKNTN